MSTKFVEWTIFDNAEALANAELKRLTKLQIQRDKAAAALAQATKAYDQSCKNHSYYVRQIMDRDHVHCMMTVQRMIRFTTIITARTGRRLKTNV
jgi:phage-related minor tail protein